MDAANALALYESFAGDRLTFLYSGSFHDEHTARLIALGEEALEQEGAAKGLRGKLAFIMVEAYQNIVRHRVPLPAPVQSTVGRSLFLLRGSESNHEVTAMNPVNTEDAVRLQAGIDRLEQLDVQQMKQVFLRGLQSDQRTDRGGAGLGLIEMARRSGNPLRHAFAPIDGTHQLFILQVLLGRANGWRSDPDSVLRLRAMVAQLGITLLFRGPLPAALQENLMRMIERDLHDDPISAERCKHAFLLMMGAVADLNVRPEGPMVCVASRPGGSSLTVALPLAPEEATRVEQAVRSVNMLEGPALQRRYRDILLGRGETAGGLELGLMDLLRRSAGRIRFEDPARGDAPFVVLQVDL